MPHELRWYPAPTNPELPVLAGLPEGATPDDWCMSSTKEARLGRRHFHFCRDCDGWIEGHPTASRVNTLGPLSGRMGIEYHCLRCGHEIGFSGMMS